MPATTQAATVFRPGSRNVHPATLCAALARHTVTGRQLVAP